uniref:Uncharacterized protein n=1 Tax=Knipowitschia caucasica TaxID=637954 RepID=A0AAV2JKE4_KNICA
MRLEGRASAQSAVLAVQRASSQPGWRAYTGPVLCSFDISGARLGRKTAHKLSLLLRNPLPISRPLRYRSTNPLGHIVMRFSPVSPRWIRRMYLRHYDARRRSLRRPLGVVDALLTDLPIHSTDSHLLSSRTAVSSLVAASLKSLSHATIADLYFKRYPRVHLKVCGSGGLCSVAGV